MEERLPRKLTAILYADVAGYSRLTGEDEEGTHRTLRAYLDRISSTIVDHSGRVVHYAGDAVLADFATVVDALSCAAAVQQELNERNSGLPEERKVQFRIGVNLGDVIVDKEEIYGDGVNIAARLESMAESGGICISESVYSAVGTKLPFDYQFLGAQEVKNIKEPVRAYRVLLEHSAATTKGHRTGRLSRRGVLVGAVIVGLLVAAGLVKWVKPWAPAVEPASPERMAFPLPDKPSIAVLPFTNLSDDPSQEYFVDGMTEDLITDLSKLSGLFVIARNSTFTYKGKSVKVRQVAEELGVRYVLEGSVRRAGEQVRINAQLIDATTGGHLWAERYDGSLADVFALQDKVTQKIVSALAINLTEDEETRRRRKETSSPDAYDAFLEGWARYRHYTRDDFIKAIPHFERALELDPNYGRAHAALAAVFSESGWNSWRVIDGGRLVIIQRAREHLQEAMKDPTPVAYRVASFFHVLENRFDDAMAQAQRAIDLDPGDPSGYEAMAWVLVHMGRPAESLQFVERAARLDPRSNYLYGIGEAQFHLERYREAVATLLKFSNSHPDNFYPFLYLASAYGHLEQEHDAKSAFKAYKNLRVSLHAGLASNAMDQVAVYFFKRGGTEEERLREGLRKAGFDIPPEVVGASSEGITLILPADGAVARVYEAAEEHCRSHGKKSIIMQSAYPNYVFSCR